MGARRERTDGLPDGMGIQFDQLDQQYGEVIDEMVRSFVGLTVLVVAASPDRLALIGRYVRSIITCEIIEATNASVAEVALEQGPDLVVVDLDLLPEMGLRCIRAAKERAAAQAHPTPVILLAGDARVRQAGKTSGADEALATPPSYHDLQAAVIRMLSRPASGEIGNMPIYEYECQKCKKHFEYTQGIKEPKKDDLRRMRRRRSSG